MKTTSTRKPRKKKKIPQPDLLSNVTKPDGMSYREWQVRLREQAAAKEAFGITAMSGEPGRYQVKNPSTRNQYEVEYHGAGHPLNSCSCMDFRTSRIGTCKHLEAVRTWISSSRGRRIQKPDPGIATIFMDYSDIPRPRIHFGTDIRDKATAFFGHKVDPDGRFNRLAELRILEDLPEAAQYGIPVLCREDVKDYLIRRRDDYFRNRHLDEVFDDSDWWRQVFAKGVRPYPYQLEGIRFAARAGRCILADEMGLGKTIQAIGTASLLYREGYVSSVLVVCPTSLKYQWKREIKTFTGADALVIEGNHLVRRQMYNQPGLFKIVSYNALNNDVKILGGLETDMVVMDEVQRLKNWGTQIARSARKVRSDYALILSGTPLENKLEELYSIVQLVDQYLLGPYYSFRAEHIETSETGKVTGYKGLNAIGKTLEPVLLRRRKADVALQLPERMDQNLFVPMTKEQMGLHEEYKDSAARIIYKWQQMHFLSETDRKRLLKFLSMMRMVCDSTFILDQQSRHDTKVEETMGILDNIFASGNEKVVIFSGWERMTRLIAQELDDRGIGYSNLNGSVPSARRKDLMDRFTDDPDVRVFLSTDAGSTGLNLQTASYLINLDLPWNPAVLEQRIGRIYRIGQQRNIQVLNLVSVNTIEEQMLTKLKFKTDLFDGVLNGGEDDVFLDDNKLETMVRNLGFMTEPEPEENSGETVVEESDMEQRETPEEKDGTVLAEPVIPDEEENTPAIASGTPEAEELVAQGISFFGNLLNTLKEPDSARALVDTIVQEDPTTGKASINIPVSGKETVLQVFSLIGKLLK